MVLAPIVSTVSKFSKPDAASHSARLVREEAATQGGLLENRDVEVAYLGFLIQHATEAATNPLSVDYFADGRHRAAYEAIVALARTAGKVDLDVLSATLTSGGMRDAGSLVAKCEVDAGIDGAGLSRILSDCRQRRQCDAFAHTLRLRAWDPTSNLNEVLGGVPLPTNGSACSLGALRWRTAREIAESSTPEVPWIAKPIAAGGSVTEIGGKIKAAGKTTFTLHLVKGILDGAQFLDEATVKSSVVWLTEQPDTSLRAALGKAGLLKRDDLHVLAYWDANALTWPAIVEAAIAKAREVGARVLVVDTLGQWAGMSGDAENNAGDGGKAMAPLQAAAATHGLAVISIRHHRKAGGDVADASRGSSAIGGAVDIILGLTRVKGHETRRKLSLLSRFDETPETLVVDLTDEGYRLVPPEQASPKARIDGRRKKLLAAIPPTHANAKTIEELVEATELARSTVQTIATALVDENLVSRHQITSDARKPYRYHAGRCAECRGDLSERATTTRDTTTAATHGHGATPDRGGGLQEPHHLVSGVTAPVGGRGRTRHFVDEFPPDNEAPFPDDDQCPRGDFR